MDEKHHSLSVEMMNEDAPQRRYELREMGLLETLAGLHFVVFVMLMLVHAGPIMQGAQHPLSVELSANLAKLFGKNASRVNTRSAD